MLKRPGCLAPIALVFVVGCLLIVGGLLGESPPTIRSGVGFLVAAAVLLAVGWWLRQRGRWD
jgi:hypothetical protein